MVDFQKVLKFQFSIHDNYDVMFCKKQAYLGKSKNRLKFLCLPEFQSHHTLRLLLSRVYTVESL